MALSAGDAWFALDEGCFLVKGRLLVCPELDLDGLKAFNKVPFAALSSYLEFEEIAEFWHLLLMVQGRCDSHGLCSDRG